MAKTLFSLILSVSLLFVAAPQAASAKAAGARIVYDSTMTANGKVMKMQTTYFIQGGAVRFETEMPAEMTGGAPGKMTMISKPKNKKYILLMEAQKMYMELPEPTQKQLKETTVPTVPFKTTGKTKTVAGYSCEVFQRTLEERSEEACAAKDLNDVFAELEKSMPKGKGEMSSLPEGLTGFPLEYSVKSVKKGASDVPEIEMRVTEFKREAIAQAKFDVPKDFQKQGMPSFEMTTQPPAKAPKSAPKKSAK